MSTPHQTVATSTTPHRCPPLAPFNGKATAVVEPATERRTLSMSPSTVPDWPPLSVSQVGIRRGQLSASELTEYVRCPRRHQYRYQVGIIETTIRALHADRLPPAMRGAAVHQYLARHRDDWTLEERRRAMLTALRVHSQSDPYLTPEAHVDDLLMVADQYLESEWHRRATAADEVRREQPFVFQLRGDMTLVGTFDLLLREGERWTIIDYKTSNLPEGVAADEGLQRLARRYEVQAAIYALALEHLVGETAVGTIVFSFLEIGGTAVELSVSAAWLDRWRQALPHVVHRARQGVYGDRPTWSPELCDGCPYAGMCRPTGLPTGNSGRAAVVTIGSSNGGSSGVGTPTDVSSETNHV